MGKTNQSGIKRFTKFAIFIFIMLLSSYGFSQTKGGHKNLQVLPNDISRDVLIEKMKGVAGALGVRCDFCHVNEGEDFDTFDFASDAKEKKKLARVMLTMVKEINEKYLPQVSHGHGEKAEVKCITCHRGKEHPEE